MKKIFYFIIVVILGCATFLWLFYTEKDYSQTTDETIYFLCARSFIEWTKTPNLFSWRVLSRYWNIGYEHPSIVKILSGVTWAVFHGKVGDIISYRFATMINFSLLTVLLYILSSSYIGRTTALCSSVFLLCIPEVIKYAHFAEINISLSIFWFLIIIFFLKGLESRFWIYISGILFGLALGSKITTLIIPIAILIWLMIYKPEKSNSSYIIFLLIGFLTFFLSWPSLWFGFPSKLMEHVRFHVVSISIRGSWHSAIKAFFFSVPPGLSVLFVIGIIGVLMERNKLGMLSLISIVVVFLVSSIFYPGEDMRHFLPAISFITILCSIGLGYLITPVIKRKIVYV